MAGILTKSTVTARLSAFIEAPPDRLLVAAGQAVLLVLSWVYGAIVLLRLIGARWRIPPPAACGVPVISVGNITVGGTGKTPLVAMIIAIVRRRQGNPAVVSRGYGAGAGVPAPADEAAMLRGMFAGLPVWENARRLPAMRQAVAAGADCVVLDDAFQQFRIKKNLEIVCFDCARPFGNGHLLPRGTLRLPRASLVLADVAVLSHAGHNPEQTRQLEAALLRYNPRLLICQAEHTPQQLRSLPDNALLPLRYLRQRRVALLCGIAQPLHFKQLVSAQQAVIRHDFFFPDHYRYTGQDAEIILRRCESDQDMLIVTTAKDAVRLPPALLASGVPLMVLEIALTITSKAVEFEQAICRAAGLDAGRMTDNAATS